MHTVNWNIILILRILSHQYPHHHAVVGYIFFHPTKSLAPRGMKYRYCCCDIWSHWRTVFIQLRSTLSYSLSTRYTKLHESSREICRVFPDVFGRVTHIFSCLSSDFAKGREVVHNVFLEMLSRSKKAVVLSPSSVRLRCLQCFHHHPWTPGSIAALGVKIVLCFYYTQYRRWNHAPKSLLSSYRLIPVAVLIFISASLQ